MENCPYCNEELEINHDDGYGYEEYTIHEQSCSNCNKTFRYTTSISIHYKLKELPCANGEEHKLIEINGLPPAYFKYKRHCEYCGEEFVIDEEANKKEIECYIRELDNKPF